MDARAPLPAVDEFDAVAFASSNTARRFLEAYPGGPAPGQLVVSIGPSTTATATALGLPVHAQAADASPAGLVRLISERLCPAAEASHGAAAASGASPAASGPQPGAQGGSEVAPA